MYTIAFSLAHPKQAAAFTLIELSIVLVIIGLIVGGVLVGQDMIKAAKQRSMVSEIEKLGAAVNTFKLKYNGLPGDLKNAESFFGTDPSGCIHTEHETPSTGTCNGDGDKRIARGTPAYNQEPFRAMQQLYLAELIDQPLTGTCFNSSGANCMSNSGVTNVGVNTLQSKGFEGGGFLLQHQQAMTNAAYGDPGSGVWYWPDTPRGHVAYFAGNDNGHGHFGSNLSAGIPGFKPIDAFAIDTKVDDGKPATGSVVTNIYAHSCETTDSAATAEYAVTATHNYCTLVIGMPF